MDTKQYNIALLSYIELTWCKMNITMTISLKYLQVINNELSNAFWLSSNSVFIFFFYINCTGTYCSLPKFIKIYMNPCIYWEAFDQMLVVQIDIFHIQGYPKNSCFLFAVQVHLYTQVVQKCMLTDTQKYLNKLTSFSIWYFFHPRRK